MAKRFFGVAVLVILALSAFGLWVTEGDHGRETAVGTAYLIAVGVSLLIVCWGGASPLLSPEVAVPRARRRPGRAVARVLARGRDGRVGGRSRTKTTGRRSSRETCARLPLRAILAAVANHPTTGSADQRT
jgi:hypothetical protein